jgi:hypothetical protein
MPFRHDTLSTFPLHSLTRRLPHPTIRFMCWNGLTEQGTMSRACAWLCPWLASWLIGRLATFVLLSWRCRQGRFRKISVFIHSQQDLLAEKKLSCLESGKSYKSVWLTELSKKDFRLQLYVLTAAVLRAHSFLRQSLLVTWLGSRTATFCDEGSRWKHACALFYVFKIFLYV